MFEIPKTVLIVFHEIYKDCPAFISQNPILLSLLSHIRQPQLALCVSKCLYILKKKKKGRAFRCINCSHTVSTEMSPYFFSLFSFPFSVFIGLLCLVSDEVVISLRLTYYVVSRVQSQTLLQPSDIHSLNACDKLKMQWIVVSVFKTSVCAHFLSS